MDYAACVGYLKYTYICLLTYFGAKLLNSLNYMSRKQVTKNLES